MGTSAYTLHLPPSGIVGVARGPVLALERNWWSVYAAPGAISLSLMYYGICGRYINGCRRSDISSVAQLRWLMPRIRDYGIICEWRL